MIRNRDRPVTNPPQNQYVLFVFWSYAVPVTYAQWQYVQLHTFFWRQLRLAIKKFSAWPSSVQNKIKIVFASYSSKAQNTIRTVRLLGYKYFVHFSVWTKCLSDGVENANTKLYTSFWRSSQKIPTWPRENLFHKLLFSMQRGSTTSDSESERQSMQWNERIGQNCHFLHCVTPFLPARRYASAGF